MSKNPYAPKRESETPPSAATAKGPAKDRLMRPVRYRWPGEYKEGKGEFNRVADDQPSNRRRSKFMK